MSSSTCSSNSDCVSGAPKCCYYRSTLTYKCCHIHEDEGNLFNLIWYSLGALFLVVICIGLIIVRCIKRKLQKNAGTGHDENKPENRRNCNQIRNAVRITKVLSSMVNLVSFREKFVISAPEVHRLLICREKYF